MEKFKTLYTELVHGILTITLNDPEAGNVLSTQSIAELHTVIQAIYDDPQIQCAIIIGTGEKAFSIGSDVEEMCELNELNARKFAENGQEAFSLIENSAKPILAAVNGDALGGGCELALACHLRIAVEGATLGFPAVMRGVIPGFGGTQRLAYLVGKSRALELLMTGNVLTAVEASNIGLVSHVASSRQAILDKSQEILHKIMTNAPLAVGALVNCTNAAYNPHEDGYQTEANAFANCCKSEDFHEGIAALLATRKPKFRGF